MTGSVWILLLFWLLNSVYCREAISVFSGEDILLPCSYTTSSNLKVFWRYRNFHNLIDIIGDRNSTSQQDPRFRNRVRTFPPYAEGNLSVVLMNVRLDDAGPYDCIIPDVDYQRQLELTVRVKPTEETSTAEAEVTSPPGGGSVSVREHSHSSLLLIMLSLILLNTT